MIISKRRWRCQLWGTCDWGTYPLDFQQ